MNCQQETEKNTKRRYNFSLVNTGENITSDSEFINSFFPIESTDLNRLKERICEIGYKTSFTNSRGNDIELSDIERLCLFCSYEQECVSEKFTGVFIDIGKYKNHLFLGYYKGNIVTDTKQLTNILNSWLKSA